MAEFLAESPSDPSTIEFLHYWQAIATSVPLPAMAEFLAESTSDFSTGVLTLLAGSCYLGSFTPMTEFLAESTSDTSTIEFLHYWQAIATSGPLPQ
jgi:hypothetical protein